MQTRHADQAFVFVAMVCSALIAHVFAQYLLSCLKMPRICIYCILARQIKSVVK